MFRHRNTDCLGKPFDPATVQAVWDRAEMSREHAPLRRDVFGALVWREGYGNTNCKLGWEIDHIQPVEQGGTDRLENLQALQWENNRRKDELIRTQQNEPVRTMRIVSQPAGVSI